MDARREPRPFPVERIPRMARARLPWLRQVARALAGAAMPDAEIGQLLGVEAKVEVAPLEHCPRGGLGAALTDPVAAVILEHSSGSLGARAALELDPKTAALVAHRALGGDGGDGAGVPVAPLGDAERGAIAYVAARLIAAAGLPFVVRGVATSAATLAGALGDEGAAVVPASLRFDDTIGLARLWLPERSLSASLPAKTRALSESLGRLPLVMAIEAAWGTIPRRELSLLRPGDAVILDESWLRPRAHGFTGEVRGRLWGAQRMSLRCAFGAEEIRIVGIEVGADPGVTRGSKMEPDTTKLATDRAGDAPVEVSVEIARFTMPLAEVAALAEGEVLATGRAIGERVTLRANGQAIATGELVDVDSEVGIRILSLAD